MNEELRKRIHALLIMGILKQKIHIKKMERRRNGKVRALLGWPNAHNRELLEILRKRPQK